MTRIEVLTMYAHLERVVGRVNEKGLSLANSKLTVPFKAPYPCDDAVVCKIIHDEVLPKYPNWECARYTVNEDGEL